MQFLDSQACSPEDFEEELITATQNSIFTYKFLKELVKILDIQNKLLVIVDPGHTMEIDREVYERTPREELVEFIKKWSNPSPEVKRHVEKQTGKLWRDY